MIELLEERIGETEFCIYHLEQKENEWIKKYSKLYDNTCIYYILLVYFNVGEQPKISDEGHPFR